VPLVNLVRFLGDRLGLALQEVDPQELGDEGAAGLGQELAAVARL